MLEEEKMKDTKKRFDWKKLIWTVLSFGLGWNMFTGCLTEDGKFDYRDCMYCHANEPNPHVSKRITADSTHAFDCSVCHFGNSMIDSSYNRKTHDDGKGDVVFDSLFLFKRFGHAPEMYYEEGTCYNIPCHGYGRIDWDSIWGEDEKGVWFRGRDGVPWYPNAHIEEKLDCFGCHDHSEHRIGHECQMCHNKGTIIDSVTIGNFSIHVNGYDEPYEEPDTVISSICNLKNILKEN
jgi:hypothetical protein